MEMEIKEPEVDIFGVDEEDLKPETGFVPTYLHGEGESPDIGLEGRVINLDGKLEGLPHYDLLIVEDRIKDAERILKAAAEVNASAESPTISKVGFCYGCRVFEKVIERLDQGPRSLVLDFELRPGKERDTDHAETTLELYRKINQKKVWNSTVVIGLTMYEDESEFEELVNALRRHGDNVFKKGDPDETKTFLTKLIKNALEKNRLQRELEKTEREVNALDQIVGPDFNLVGSSTEIREAKRDARRIAPKSTPVLLTGEFGTQRYNFAKYIHALSGRENFERINCATVSDSTIFDSEKEGDHVDGNKSSRIKSDVESTLFLKEISELSIRSQVELVRLLKKYRKSEGEFYVNQHRVIASTTEDLYKLVESGEFIDELYFMLDFEITLPPLRNRKEDIIPLSKQFIEQLNNESDVYYLEGLEDDAEDLLRENDWSDGNVYMLKKEIKRGFLLSGEEDEMLRAKHIRIESDSSESDKTMIGDTKVVNSEDYSLAKIQTAKEKLDKLEPVVEKLLNAVPKITNNRISNQLDISPQRISQIFSESNTPSSLYKEIEMLMRENPNKWMSIRDWRKQQAGQQF